MGWRPLARPGSVIREECSRAVSQGRAAGAAPTRPSKPPNCLQLLEWLSCQGPAWARGLHAGGRPAPSSGNGALQKARVNGPRSGPPWPAQVQPFPGQAALGRAETLWQAGGGGRFVEVASWGDGGWGAQRDTGTVSSARAPLRTGRMWLRQLRLGPGWPGPRRTGSQMGGGAWEERARRWAGGQGRLRTGTLTPLLQNSGDGDFGWNASSRRPGCSHAPSLELGGLGRGGPVSLLPRPAMDPVCKQRCNLL